MTDLIQAAANRAKIDSEPDTVAVLMELGRSQMLHKSDVGTGPTPVMASIRGCQTPDQLRRA